MFTHLSQLNWLWILPFLGASLVFTALRRRRTLMHMAGPNAAEALMRETPSGLNALRVILLFCSLALLIIALAGPAWNPVEEKVDRQGRDVVFVLDVSRSMLAEDLRPSRLERAKADVAECITALQGDRVALVAFAGNAVVQCPLTQDYGFFRMMLADLTPESVTRGGTNLGDALRLVQRQVFNGADKEFKDVILITDGEDHDSLPVAAAQELGAAGIRLIAIGIGDDNVGAPIQVTDERGYKTTLKYHGEVVRSKLDSKTLREMAQATPGGVYLPVGTNAFDLRETYTQLVVSAAKRDLDAEVVVHLQPKFQIFVGTAMLLLALAALLPQRRRIAFLPLVLLLLSTTALSAQSARTLFKEGNSALKNGNFQAALDAYDNAAQLLENEEKPIWKELEFNRALVYYRSGSPENLAQAKELLLNAVELNRSSKNENGNFDNNCQLLLGNVNHSLAKIAYETALSAKDSDNPQEIQQALQLVESHKDVINDAIHSLKQAKTNRRNRTAVQHTLKQSRILRKKLHELEKELREKLKEQQQNQQNDKQQQQGQQDSQQNQQGQQDKQDQQNQQGQQDKQDQQNQQGQQDKQDQQNQQDSQQDQQQQQSQESQQNQQDKQDQQDSQQNQQGQQDKQDQQNQQDSQQDQQQQQSQESQRDQQDQQDQQQQAQESQDSQNQEPKAAQAVKAEDAEQSPPEQAKPLEQELQQIINAEKQRRMQQRARQSRQNPVDKDW